MAETQSRGASTPSWFHRLSLDWWAVIFAAVLVLVVVLGMKVGW
jgi:hypothetical protein